MIIRLNEVLLADNVRFGLFHGSSHLGLRLHQQWLTLLCLRLPFLPKITFYNSTVLEAANSLFQQTGAENIERE